MTSTALTEKELELLRLLCEGEVSEHPTMKGIATRMSLTNGDVTGMLQNMMAHEVVDQERKRNPRGAYFVPTNRGLRLLQDLQMLGKPPTAPKPPEVEEQKDAKAVSCQYCGKLLKDNRGRGSHERHCDKNPNRNLRKGEFRGEQAFVILKKQGTVGEIEEEESKKDKERKRVLLRRWEDVPICITNPAFDDFRNIDIVSELIRRASSKDVAEIEVRLRLKYGGEESD